MRRNLAPSQQRKPDSGFCPPSILGPSGAGPKPFPIPRPPTAFVARQQQPVPVDSGFVNTGLKLKPFIQTLEKLCYQYYHTTMHLGSFLLASVMKTFTWKHCLLKVFFMAPSLVISRAWLEEETSSHLILGWPASSKWSTIYNILDQHLFSEVRTLWLRSCKLCLMIEVAKTYCE